MPTYEYLCTACGDRREVVQSFTEDSLTTCQVCAGKLRKVIYPVGIQFKGSGFYSTDRKASRPMSRVHGDSKSESSSEKSDGSSEGKQDSKSESKGESKGDSKSDSKGDKSSSGDKASQSPKKVAEKSA